MGFLVGRGSLRAGLSVFWATPGGPGPDQPMSSREIERTRLEIL